MNDVLDTTQFQKRLTRARACAFLAERLGVRVSPGTIRRWPIAYLQIGRDASYAENDLQRFVEQRLEAAPHCMPLPPKTRP
jgi:hypothetical protein